MEISGGEFDTAPDSSLISSDCIVDEDGSIVDASLSVDGIEHATLKEALNALTYVDRLPLEMGCRSSRILTVTL